MAASSSWILLLLAATFTASASAATFTIKNNCGFTPPMTLAEFTIGGSQDFYDISVIDGFNIGMAFSCSTGVGLVCRDSSCPDAYHQPNDMKTHACGGNSNYQVTFCP
ncbi:unnamed protein product [Miscanthus lutarioriparius]|uniref:Thaumatin-like protein n=1 Tax=Miscanthus lutarioriparius TaxID=422564 RepID=A0A811R9L9_9POAL|nr:unnamed protein product [Miscanthus lutarioriparius]